MGFGRAGPVRPRLSKSPSYYYQHIWGADWVAFSTNFRARLPKSSARLGVLRGVKFREVGSPCRCQKSLSANRAGARFPYKGLRAERGLAVRPAPLTNLLMSPAERGPAPQPWSRTPLESASDAVLLSARRSPRNQSSKVCSSWLDSSSRLRRMPTDSWTADSKPDSVTQCQH